MPKGVEQDAEAIAAELAESRDVDLEDLPPAGADRRRREDPNDDDGNDRKPAGLEYHTDPRDDLIKNFRKNRAEQGRELSADFEDDAAEEEAELHGEDDEGDDDPEVRIVPGPGAREVNQPVSAKPEPRVVELRDDDLVVTQVDGQKVEMTFKELKDRAQKDAASDNRLKSANEILDEVRALAAEIKNPAPAARQDGRPGERTVGEQPGGASHRSETKEQLAERLTAAIDSIQTDTPERAANALADILAELRGSQTNAPDVQQEVRSIMANAAIDQQANDEISTAFTSVSDTFGDIIGDKRLGESAYSDVIDKVVAGLHEIGVPDEDFVGQSPQSLIKEYARLRQDPNWRGKLTPLNDLFFEAAGDARVWKTGDISVPASNKGKPYNPPARAAGESRRNEVNGATSASTGARIVRTTDRGARKQGVNLQPRSASVRSDFSGNAAPGTRKDTSKTVAEMAAARK